MSMVVGSVVLYAAVAAFLFAMMILVLDVPGVKPAFDILAS